MPEKGLDRLIRAFAQVHRCTPDTRLVIFGDGPERAALQNLVWHLGLTGAVELAGFVSTVPAVSNEMDIFVLPSLTEGVPLALLEAMAAGVPVIATRLAVFLRLSWTNGPASSCRPTMFPRSLRRFGKRCRNRSC